MLHSAHLGFFAKPTRRIGTALGGRSASAVFPGRSPPSRLRLCRVGFAGETQTLRQAHHMGWWRCLQSFIHGPMP